jgi:hypothetical protein
MRPTSTSNEQCSAGSAPNRQVRFSPDRLVLETDAAEVIDFRDDPREAFAGHTNGDPLGSASRRYFDAYAMWTYLTQPFLYTYSRLRG